MKIKRVIFSRQGFLLILTMIGLVAINLVWLLPTIRNIQNSASTLALSIATRVGSDISSILEDSLRDLNRAAEEIAFEPGRKEFVLRRLLKHNFGFRNAALVNADGSEEIRIDQLKLITAEDFLNHSKDAHFYLALQGAQTIGAVYISPELEVYSTIAVPVSRVGKVNQVLVADLNLRELVAAIKTPGLDQGHIYITDKDGFQILHPSVAELIRRPNYIGRPVVQKVIYEGRVADGLAREDSYANDNGEKVFTVGLPLAGTSWGLFVEQPRNQAFGGERQAIAFAGATVVLGMFVFLIISWSSLKLGRLNEALKDLLNENYESGKMLVRRDIELSEANVRLQELDRVKSEFVSLAAHQLRTPLTGIRWSYHALLEEETGRVNAEQKNLIEKGLQAALSMIDLINNLLNVARIEEGRFGYKFELKSIVPVIESSCRSFEEPIREKGLKFEMSIPKYRLPLLNLDEGKMAMVMNNLLDNAIKYTLPRGEISIRVLAPPKNGSVTVEIKDSGIGIPAKQMYQMFTKFFRADNAMFFQTMGNGLGLYVVKNIVERHGGTISAASVEGQGTTFTIKLPIPADSKKI